jgi:phage virion morphogenesis protein
MKVETRIDDKAVMAALNRLSAAGADLTPAMREIAGVLADAAEEAFAQQRDPTTGDRWADLEESTKKRREKGGHWPGSILQVTGALARDIESDYGADFAVVGTNKPHATTHQHGAKKGEFGAMSIVRTRRVVPLPWGDIPARPFLGIGAGDKEDILGILHKHLQRALEG